MLREQHQVFRGVLLAVDATVLLVAQIAAFSLRFHVFPTWEATRPWFPPHPGGATYVDQSIPPVVAVGVLLGTMLWAGLYRPRRDQRFFGEAAAITKAVLVGWLILFAWLDLFEKILYEGEDFSRGQALLFGAAAFIGLLIWRQTFRIGLRWIRRRGWNLRHVAIIGTGRLAQVTCKTLQRNSWTGISPRYFVSHHGRTSRRACLDLPARGGLDELERLLEEYPVSGVFLALPQRYSDEIPRLLARLERFPVDVRLIPDVNPRHSPFNMSVHELDGMPILSVRESPLKGWGRLAKRTIDVVGATAALTVFALPMLAIAALVRASGPGPVIFRQPRASLGGRVFNIYKFRTMRHASDEQPSLEDLKCGTEAWTRENDDRVTRIGRILRRTSLDELPQLFNVLLGEMSLVGPRPERPELVARFREDWRGYMLRQHVKAGITGWAQVNGLRGNTSLRKRLQYDLFYIRHWSIGFDLRILWLTLFSGFVHPNAR